VTDDKRGDPRPVVNGILNVDKPAEITTMDVVRRIKRASRQKRVGHGGTLDPIATGVVPICIGQATRMMEYLIEGTREYRSGVELGVATDTYDAHGQVVSKQDPSSVTLTDVEQAVDSFRGSIEQVPPMYSALKRDGKRLYDLARAGVEVEREARKIQVSRLEILDWSPPIVTLEISCGRGFYMRSLAHDLGQVLGCGAHMKTLVRLGSGPFRLADSLTLEVAEERIADDSWFDDLYHPDCIVVDMRAMIVGKETEAMLRHGRPLPPGLRIPAPQPGEQCRAYGTDGGFIAIISFDASEARWRPERVFSMKDPERTESAPGLVPR